MKNLYYLLFAFGIIMLTQIGCKDESEGEVMFWSDFNSAPIKVYVEDDYKGRIHSYYGSVPDCGSSGCVTIELEEGTYSYYAETEDGSMYWSGSFKSRSNTCSTYGLSDFKATKKLIDK